MTSRDFCNWLKGYFELTEQKEISAVQVECIQNHLAMVFKYEIDPSYGNQEMQNMLQDIHDGNLNTFPNSDSDNSLYKC